MIHKTYKYNTNSLKKLKENLDDDEIFSNISKENSLKKKLMKNQQILLLFQIL